jgi:hypothetical protein
VTFSFVKILFFGKKIIHMIGIGSIELPPIISVILSIEEIYTMCVIFNIFVDLVYFELNLYIILKLQKSHSS